MASRRESERQAIQKAKDRQRQKKKQDQMEMTGMQQAFQAQNGDDASLVRELLNNDDLVEGGPDDLQDVTIAKIENLLGQDILLSNFTAAQENDIRYKLEVLKYKILGTHPPQESEIQGPIRAYLWDDEMEDLHPLTQQERLIVDDLIETLKARVTRGREGFERKQQNTSIAHTESASPEDDGKGGIFTGLFD